jgi:hypothetical protein
MKQKGFAMIFLLVGILIIGVVGYVGFNVWLSNNILHTGLVIPTISPIPTFVVDQQSDDITFEPNGLLPTRAPNEDNDYKRKNDLISIRNAIEMYAVDHQGSYPTKLSVLGEPYLKFIPKDPVTNEEYEFKMTSPGVYTISAKLSNGSLFTVTNP